MRFLLLAIQMLFLALPLRADDVLSRYVDAKRLQELRAGATLTASITGTGVSTLLPSVTARDLIAEHLKTMRPTVGGELLRIITGSPELLDTRDGWLKIYNSLHAVSSMRGITYWSVSRGSRQVLFTQSYAISSPGKAAPVPDVVFEEIPGDSLLYTFQEDKSFGRTIYEERFAFRADHLAVSIENLSTISFALIPIIRPRNLVSTIVLVPTGREILFYGLACFHTSLPIGDKRSKEVSLTNRLVAMADWLAARIAGTGTGTGAP